MKKKDLKNITMKKTDEIKRELTALENEYQKTKMNIISGREKNLKKAKNIKKSISQIKTILRFQESENKEANVEQ